MDWWHAAAGANVVIAAAYFSIAYVVGRGLTGTRQWGRNPLAVATFSIFLTCAAGHALHAEHLLVATGGAAVRDGVRAVIGDWHQAVVDLATAAVAVWYLAQRKRLRVLVTGNGMFDDLDDRQRTALEVNDDVIQGLATAKLALDVGEIDEARQAVEHVLGSSRQVVDKLMAPLAASGGVRPGDLRRRVPVGQP